MARRLRLLCASNGHGEDDITAKVVDALRRDPAGLDLEIEAWAMVGAGGAYAARGIPLVGPQNLLPSEGFGTLSLGALWRDIAHGFLGLILSQIRFARSIRGRYDLMLATGDIVPLMAGKVSRTPMCFISCAKSAYYDDRDGHTPGERKIMRTVCRASFPRDRLTAERLSARGVPCTYLGNPMMDGLDPVAPEALRRPGTTVAMIPGSRQDATENALLLLAAAAELARTHETPSALNFVFGAHDVVDLDRIAGAAPGWRASEWPNALDERGPALCLAHATGTRALLVKRRFADVLHAADLAVGMAGTANEQAIGLGLPLVTVPGLGNQGDAYVKMKQRYYGEAALLARRDPMGIADRLREVLSDPDLRARMADAGRERMGEPGASAAIARVLVRELTGEGAR